MRPRAGSSVGFAGRRVTGIGGLLKRAKETPHGRGRLDWICAGCALNKPAVAKGSQSTCDVTKGSPSVSGKWLYRRHDVIRRLESGEAVVYRCIERIPERGYVVQSADRVRLPLSREVMEQHERQFWELLCEADPRERGGLHPTLEEAITAFDKDFNGEPGT
jgi:hypothetical protein